MRKRPLPPGVKLYSEKATKVFDGVRFDVYQWQQKQFDGSTATFEMVKRADSVFIIPVIDDEVIVVKEMQPHWEKPAHTLVAGMVHLEEDLDVAARRELEEETGLVFENYHLVHVESNSIEWFAYTFVATGYTGRKEKKLDAGEKNEVEKISVDKLIEMTRTKKFFHRPRYVEDMLMQGRLEDLKNTLKDPKKYSIDL